MPYRLGAEERCAAVERPVMGAVSNSVGSIQVKCLGTLFKKTMKSHEF